MQKQKADIPKDSDGKWGTYISKYPADSGRVQPSMLTSGTRNVVSSLTGNADKRPGGTPWNPSSLLSGPILDQYEGIFPSGTRLMIVNDAGTLKASPGNGIFTTITAGFTNPANFEFATYQSRVYGCNGIDQPIVMDTLTSYGGVTYSFSVAKTRQMGAIVPGSAPTATRASDATANQVPAGSHTYKITFVYYSGTEESNGSAVSGVCVNDASHTSNSLSSIPVGGYGVTARNIYRDNNDGNWLLLDTLGDNTTTTYTDKLPIGSTPTPIPTTHGQPPTFRYIVPYLDRLFVIDSTGRNIYWSSVGQPDVFEPANAMLGPQDDTMTAIVIFNGIPWVFGQHTVGTILGTTDGTFFYNPVSPSVGCVDNRSIQTRSIVSTPTLIWLSAIPNKGLYYTNGSTVQYLSDFIEDLTFNLVQVGYLQRQNIQNTQAAFNAGTTTPSIDLVSNPGTVQTINPRASFSHASDWAAGVVSNMVVSGDQLMVPTSFASSPDAGSVSGSAIVNSAAGPRTITLSGSSAYTGEDHAETTLSAIFQSPGTAFSTVSVAAPFIPARSGTMTNMVFFADLHNLHQPVFFTVWSDSAGAPGSILYSSALSPGGGAQNYSASPSLSVTAGTKYWFGFRCSYSSINGDVQVGTTTSNWSGGSILINVNVNGQDTVWTTANITTISGTVSVSYTPVASSGTWTSPVNDTHSTTIASGLKLQWTGSYPHPQTSVTVNIQGSNDASTWVTTDHVDDPAGTYSVAGSGYRYWRLVASLTTTDNVFVPQLISSPVLLYALTGTWTSTPILCTTDITSFSNLILSAFIPAGTTATITIATSASSGSGYSSFTDLAHATPNTYAKILVTLTANSTDTSAATLLSAELDWAVSGTFTSSAIDTGVVPAGWGLFQFTQAGVGGTISFFFRSASTSLGLASASYSAVTNGAFPASSPLQFCQWKIVMTATAGSLPMVNSVIVNWLLTTGGTSNIRAASLFFNKSYYLSVATSGNTSNNLLIELDYEGNWRIHNETIGTLCLYFNDAFQGDSTSGNILNSFKLPTDNGTPISYDLRTKALGPGDDEHYSIARSLRVKGVNTGTTIHAYYSPDLGTTWIEMLNSSGTTGYTTTNDLSVFNEYFVPNFDGSVKTSGLTIIYRVVSSDAFPCSIKKLQPTIYVRQGKFVKEATV